MDETKSDILNFKTNVLLKSIIGKDLITDDHIAVLELVKNSFDANSKIVDIIFSNTKKNSDSNDEAEEKEELRKKREDLPFKEIILPRINCSKIIIQDFGKGMSREDIEHKWLNIAYSEKKSIKKDKGRLLAGNKGVGRFSCDRLGKFLNIYTKRINSNEYIHLFIDWRKFEKEDKIDLKIQDIPLEIKKIPKDRFEEFSNYKPFKKGTLLEICHLRESWNRNKILKLKRNLEKHLNPNQAFKDDNFKIKISAEEYKDDKSKPHLIINGLVENKVFEKLNFKTTYIKAQIDPKGLELKTTLVDKGREIFTLIEENKFDLLKNIEITLYYLNPYAKAYFMRQTGIRSKQFGSIFLFLNGFRIPPYGDDGNDWLGLETRKGQGYSRYLGTRELIGRIEIIDNDDSFQIISNREGLVKTPTFKQLIKDKTPYGLYLKTHRRLERYVVEGLNWDRVNQKDEFIETIISKDPNWNEEKEEYLEDSFTKNRRALNSIIPIINANKSEIKSLQINETFVKDVVSEAIIKNTNDLNKILEEIENKDYNSEYIEIMISKLGSRLSDVNEFKTDLRERSAELQNSKSEILKLKKVENKFNETLKELELLKKEKQEKEAIAAAAEEKRIQLEKELELEKEKNTYLKASSKGLSEEAKGLVHNIKLTTKIINSNVDTLYEKIKTGNIKTSEILRRLGDIKFSSEKVLKISNLITRANFKSQANTQTVDIVKYIEQYIDIYSSIFEKNQINFVCENSNQASLIKKVSILDLSLILDDLISNSNKANAKNIKLKFFKGTESEDSRLRLLFSDDGDGLIDEFIDNPEKIFELGITRAEGGSGIGMNSVRKALKKMKARIKFYGNNKLLKGATFEIIFN